MRRPGFGPNTPQSYNSQGRGYEPNSPQDSYGQNDGFDAAPVSGAGYGRPPPQRQFSHDQHGAEQYANRPFPTQPLRQYSSDSQQPLAPVRQYSDGPGYPQDSFQQPRVNRLASPPLQNNSGFDFGGQQEYQSRQSPPPQQYSRPSPPQIMYESSSRPSPGGRGNEGYFANNAASRSPPPEEPTYPGYKPYQPSQGGRGREPQGWDPVQQ